MRWQPSVKQDPSGVPHERHGRNPRAFRPGRTSKQRLFGPDPDQMIAVARHAEDCGFESFYVSEHIALYPGASMGSAQIPPSFPIADPLECLSFVAAGTERIDRKSTRLNSSHRC